MSCVYMKSKISINILHSGYFILYAYGTAYLIEKSLVENFTSFHAHKLLSQIQATKRSLLGMYVCQKQQNETDIQVFMDLLSSVGSRKW